MLDGRRRWSRRGPSGGLGCGLGCWAAPAARAPRRPATTARASWPRDARVPDCRFGCVGCGSMVLAVVALGELEELSFLCKSVAVGVFQKLSNSPEARGRSGDHGGSSAAGQRVEPHFAGS